MKKTIVFICCLTLFISCWSERNVSEKLTFNEVESFVESKKMLGDRVKFSFDSLHNINYFDYYGKTLEELMENNVINQNKGYIPTVAVYGSFGYLGLIYVGESEHRELRIYFTDLKYTDESILKTTDYVPPERFLKETIRKIQFGYRYQILTKTEEEAFLENLKNIDIENYIGKPIENIIPILKKWSSISFDYTKSGDKRCLDDFYFFYVLEEGSAMVVIEPLTFDYTERCIDVSNKSWNLNNLRKELVGDIKIRH